MSVSVGLCTYVPVYLCLCAYFKGLLYMHKEKRDKPIRRSFLYVSVFIACVYFSAKVTARRF